MTDLFGKDITLATTLLIDFLKITTSLMTKWPKTAGDVTNFLKSQFSDVSDLPGHYEG